MRATEPDERDFINDGAHAKVSHMARKGWRPGIQVFLRAPHSRAKVSARAGPQDSVMEAISLEYSRLEMVYKCACVRSKLYESDFTELRRPMINHGRG